MPTVAISFKFRDLEGVELTEVLHFDATDVTTLALAQANATLYAGLLSALSGCAVVAADVLFNLTVPTPSTPATGYYVDAGAYLSFLNGDGVRDGFYVPGMLMTQVVNRTVNPDTTQMQDLILEATGGSGSTGDPISTRGSGAKFNEYVRGFTTTRKIPRRR